MYYGNIFIFTGQDIKKGLEEVRTAVTLDPLSPSLNWALGNRYTNVDKNEEAIKQYRKTLTLDSSNLAAVIWIGYSLIKMHKYDEAIDVLKGTKRKSAMQPGLTVAIAHAQNGETSKAREEVEELKRGANGAVDHVFMARLYVSLHEYDSAFTYIEKAYDTKTLNLMSLNNDSFFDPVRNMPRFKAILRKLNFI